MLKKWTRTACFLMAGVLFLSNPMIVSAVTQSVESLEKKINKDSEALSSAKDEKKDLKSDLKEVQEKKRELESAKLELASDVQKMDQEMLVLETKINDLETLLEEKQAEVDQAKVDLKKAQEDIEKQYEEMKIRIRFMYEHGSTTYINILLGAGSFGEMLNKAEYIEQLSEYDRMMLVKFQDTKDEIGKLEKNLEGQVDSLDQQKKAVDEKKQEMNGLIKDKESEIVKFQEDIKDQQAAIEEYESMIAEQDATIKALEAAVAASKAAKKAAEEERAKQSVSGNSSGYKELVFGGGPFCWPAPSYTRVSDPFGYRMHPILKVQQFHNGLDLAAPSGSAILAAADGIVVAAAYSSTMGNYVMIDHGSDLFTIYMHASSLNVSNGQSVKKGDRIASVGSTGRSTGAHLHFGVRKNGSYVNPGNYL